MERAREVPAAALLPLSQTLRLSPPVLLSPELTAVTCGIVTLPLRSAASWLLPGPGHAIHSLAQCALVLALLLGTAVFPLSWASPHDCGHPTPIATPCLPESICTCLEGLCLPTWRALLGASFWRSLKSPGSPTSPRGMLCCHPGLCFAHRSLSPWSAALGHSSLQPSPCPPSSQLALPDCDCGRKVTRPMSPTTEQAQGTQGRLGRLQAQPCHHCTL